VRKVTWSPPASIPSQFCPPEHAPDFGRGQDFNPQIALAASIRLDWLASRTSAENALKEFRLALVDPAGDP